MLALCAGPDPLSFFRSLAEGAPRILKPGGLLIVEVGDDQAGAARQAIEATNGLTNTAVVKDRVVGQERVLVFKRT